MAPPRTRTTVVVPFSPHHGDLLSSAKGGPTLHAASRTTAPPPTVIQQRSKLRPRFPRLATLRPTTRQYSVGKFKELDAYCTHITWRRIAFVLLVVPLPGLAVSIVPCFVRLQAVRDGPNWGLVVHLASAVASSTFGFILTWLQVTSVPRATYSLPQLLAVCGLTTLLHTTLFSAFSFYVLFPTPFAWVTGTPVLFTGLVVAHLLVLRSRLWTHPVLRTAAINYMPSAFIQVSQIALYPAISALFDNVTQFWQVVLTLTFPILKYALKTYLRKVSAGLKDFSAEVAVCGVEITASLYQSMIMQTSPTLATMGCIIGLDLLQGVAMVKLFVDKHWTALGVSPEEDSKGSVLPYRHQLIPLARILLRSPSAPAVHTHGTTVSETTTAAPIVAEALLERELAALSAAMSLGDRRHTLSMALETLDAAEEILLTQYIEVIVPVINGVFLAVATQFSSGRYNTRLASFYESPATTSGASTPLATALQSIALYSFLQAITLVVMQGVLKKRYGISAMSYLAFILEHHGLSIVGKMMAWLPVILHFTLVQYGTDFTFSFHWDRTG